jgi:hypothetical protein
MDQNTCDRIIVFTGLNSIMKIRSLSIEILMTEIFADVTFPDPPFVPNEG